ncbi:redoxin domain-containing protein [Flavobacterium sp. RHBU_3]|uniref:redoxin domain-containing protein n=1 Tax=Flavobacterium sp. RHBU_3 TaxID=3391184 RepID=UPI0039854FB3
MKKIALLLSLSLLAISCKQLGEKEYEITGTVDPSWEGKMVILERPLPNGTTPIDTVMIHNAEFKFKDTISAPDVYYLRFQPKSAETLDFVLEPGSIDIEVDKDTIIKSKLSGTYNNEKFEDLKRTFKTHRMKLQSFEKNNLRQYKIAEEKKDTVTTNKLMKQRKELLEKLETDITKFVTDNPKALASLNGVTIVHRFHFKDDKEVKAMFDKLDAAVKNTVQGKQIADYFKRMEEVQAAVPQPAAAPAKTTVKVGDTAPQFSGKTPEGGQLALGQVMGKKATIIDFWASWCGPCRKESPALVALYKKYHDKGLNIISVSLDDNEQAWKDAIKKDGLTWSHVSNLKRWEDPIALMYGVEQIPAPFLLDANGKVIVRDVVGENLAAEVAKLIK